MSDTTTTAAPFEPCSSRFLNFEGGDLPAMLGCLRDAADGHTRLDGLQHRNRGFQWSGGVAHKGPRCESTIRPPGQRIAIWRCVEGAGHYPSSIHTMHGSPPEGWTDEMSLNPPALSASTVVPVCGDLFVSPGDQREDAYTCDGIAGHLDKGVMHGGSNRAGKTAAWGDGAGLKNHPDEPTVIKLSVLRDQLARAADLLAHKQDVIDELAARLEDQHRRTEAARLSVRLAATMPRWSMATVADGCERFERYLLDGTPVDIDLPDSVTQEGAPMQPEPVQLTDTEIPPPITRGAAAHVQQQHDTDRDSADLERIRAWWSNNEPGLLVAEHDGDAVAATLVTLAAHFDA